VRGGLTGAALMAEVARRSGRRGSRHGRTPAWRGCTKTAATVSRRWSSGSTWLHRVREATPANSNGSSFTLARGGRGTVDPWLWRLRRSSRWLGRVAAARRRWLLQRVAALGTALGASSRRGGVEDSGWRPTACSLAKTAAPWASTSTLSTGKAARWWRKRKRARRPGSIRRRSSGRLTGDEVRRMTRAWLR
jgi:hypothetical protein